MNSQTVIVHGRELSSKGLLTAPSVKRQCSGVRKRKGIGTTVLGFLLPNLLGFLMFTLGPVLLSLWMAFTNWSLKPAVEFSFLGLRNFNDLLGVRPLADGNAGVCWGYFLAAVVFAIGLVTALWANVAQWRGVRPGGVVLAAVGLCTAGFGFVFDGGQGLVIAGLIGIGCGVAVLLREGEWKLGLGMAPAIAVTAGALGLWLFHVPMWDAYEPRDLRFWKFFYNTVYLMLGIPFSIAGSLALAMLLSDSFPSVSARLRGAGAGLCLAGGCVTLAVVWSMGYPNVALLGGLLWSMAALGLWFNVMAFRTIFYLPTFTAGVALMILWKALYNPDTGPINMSLGVLMAAMHLPFDPPKWLASVAWAKPALIFMGFWIGIGGTNMLLYLAGLSNVSQELIDAAHVDGAGAWKRFRHVIWPQLAPTTFFISVMSIIGGLQGGFEQARVMTGGGPAGSTTTLSYYIYNKAFQDLDLGYASAISWVLFAMIFVATAINWKFGKDLEVG